tara:strand:+ start:101 stop:394 length:294 start_codon:yes stop_codon:yes gene_type:complete
MIVLLSERAQMASATTDWTPLTALATLTMNPPQTVNPASAKVTVVVLPATIAGLAKTQVRETTNVDARLDTRERIAKQTKTIVRAKIATAAALVKTS